MFKSFLSESQVIILLKDGKLKACGDSRALDSQIQQLQSLKQRIEDSDSIRRFLASYDAIMRLAEIQVVISGYLFDAAPHVGMRQIVMVICPEFSENALKRLSDIRHLAKKNSISPANEDFEELENIRKLMEARTSQI